MCLIVMIKENVDIKIYTPKNKKIYLTCGQFGNSVQPPHRPHALLQQIG